MSDDQAANAPNDPLQVGNIIHEAFQVITGDAVAEQEEGHAIEALSESFQTYVQSYVHTISQTWDQSIEDFQAEVAAWQTSLEKPAGGGATDLQAQFEALKRKLAGGGGQTGGASGAATAAGPRKPGQPKQD